jgi:hypothetical protein
LLFCGLLFFAVRLRLILDFFAFRFFGHVMPPFPVEWWPRPLGTEGTGRKSGPCSHGVESGLILQYCPINQALILCNMVNGLSHLLSVLGQSSV